MINFLFFIFILINMSQYSENEIAFFKQLLLDFDVRIDGRNKMQIRKYDIKQSFFALDEQ